ncbi:gfo/Idh/MocA family oxidoreductase, partial [Streptomyces sp. NPDC059668]
MTDLRLGVLGFGLRGPLALTAHRPGRGSRVTVLAEHDPLLRESAAARIPGVRTVDDHRRGGAGPAGVAVVGGPPGGTAG